ncbi:hypothetical protein [Streptomyces sp. CBMA152]|uniref:hypothetical protein n=1 Tax=Streptomyces sp. CBMA152 TaxID=1896312 RepID=UPI0016606FD7|nr:hypothetical protein [Streptomyces sp. CBMA152]MBD0746043.1 hypothetical protein [Streptomyces sp. CBMA152]
MTQLAMPALGHWNTPYLTAAALVLACAGLLDSLRIRRRTRRNTDDQQPGTPAVKVAALAAIGCTAYSADTSWRFAADYLNMSGTTERTAMFAAAELALFATALLARQNLNGPKQTPGLPGAMTWVITTVQVIPAYAESGPVGGTVRAFVGPVMAALLWHQAMGIELRLRKPDAASNSFLARVGWEMRERLLSCLGIAERDRDAAQITRDRATHKAVDRAAYLAESTPNWHNGWRRHYVARHLSKAIARASVGTDSHQRQVLLHQLAARRHATALATIELPSPWTDSTSAGDLASPIAPTLPPSQSGVRGSAERKEAKKHPDPDHQPGALPPPSVQPPLPLHETTSTPTSTEPSTEEAGPMTQRFGRPPGAEMAELLAIGRKAIKLHGKNTRAVLRNAIRDEAGLTIAEDRLTELKALLAAEQGAETGARTD